MRYKYKVKKRREKIPCSRVFSGRSKAAKNKPRKDGKFSTRMLGSEKQAISENV